MRFVAGLVSTALLGLGLAPHPSHGAQVDQEGVRGVSLSLETSLGDESGEGFVGSTLNVVATDTRIFVSIREIPSEIRVFSRVDGSFERVLGRSGEGPGEYRAIAALEVMTGDSLLVYDRGLQRITILSPDLTVARTVVPDIVINARGVVEHDGRWAANGYALTSEQTGHQVHLLDPSTGQVTASLGSASAASPASTSGATGYRWLASGPRGHLWSAHMMEYEIERYRGARLEATIGGGRDGAPAWFSSGSEPDDPPPQILDVAEDSAGLLWIVGRTANSDWGEALTAVAPIVHDTGHESFVLEAIDVASGQAVARTGVPAFVGGFLDHGRLYTIRQTPELTPVIEVWRYEMSPIPE